MLEIAEECPTFSWGGVSGADAYELVVFDVTTEKGADVEADPVLQRRIDGSALSFTPALGECLESGRQYAWFVRGYTGRRASGWSEPLLLSFPRRRAEPSWSERCA